MSYFSMDASPIKQCWVVLTDVLKHGNFAQGKQLQTNLDNICNWDQASNGSRFQSPVNFPTSTTAKNDFEGRNEENSDDEIQIITEVVSKTNVLGTALQGDEANLCQQNRSNPLQISSHPVEKKRYRKRRPHKFTWKKRSHKNAYPFSSQHNFAKSLLLQKYGKALLREPSFSFDLTGSETNATRLCKSLDEAVPKAKTNEFLKIKPSNIGSVSVDRKAFLNNSLKKELHEFCVAKDCNSTSQTTSKLNPIPLIIQGKSQCLTNPSSPMPSVGLVLSVGVGHPITSIQAKCVMDHLDNCKDSLTAEYANFCSTVVLSPHEPRVERVILPVTNDRVLNFMQLKWKSKTAVKQRKHLRSQNMYYTEKRLVPHELYLNQNTLPPLRNTAQTGGSESKFVTNLEKVQGFQTNLKNDDSMDWGSEEPSAKNTAMRSSRKQKIKCSKYIQQPTEPPKIQLERKQKNSKSRDEKENALSHSLPAAARSTLSLPRKPIIEHNDFQSNVDSKVISEGQQKLKFENSRKVHKIQTGLTKDDSDDESFSVKWKTVNHVPVISYDPDDKRGVEGFEEVSKIQKEELRKKSGLMHEMRRLNVALYDVPSSSGPTACRSPDICRLGCVCGSLLAQVVRDHCGLVECLFGCVCSHPQVTHQDNLGKSFSWIETQAKANLAKEEKHFKQTVVRSEDNIILVESKRKRQIKLPARFLEDFVISKAELPGSKYMNSNVEPEILRKVDSQPKVLLKQNSKKGEKRTLHSQSLSGEERQISKPIKSRKLSSSVSCRDNQMQSVFAATSSFNIESLEKSHCKMETCVSARTRPFFHKSKENRHKLEDLKKQQHETSPAVSDLQIVSTQSLSPSVWAELENECTENEDGFSSCSHIFSPDYMKSKGSNVVLLSWDSLKSDIDQKKIFLWLKILKQNAKVYLTQSSVKPMEDCVEFQSIDLNSDNYKLLPFHLRSLRLDYTLTQDEKKCSWIAQCLNSLWMIVGYLQPGICSGENLVQQQNVETGSFDLDVLSSSDNNVSVSWWYMDINQKFDLIYFLDSQKGITTDQITTLINLSNEDAEKETKLYRILVNRRRAKLDESPPFPDFGAYSLPGQPTKVFIGPYYAFREPRFLVYSKKVALNGKEEFEAVPLYCHMGRGFVRVNSRGALSLSFEDPPSNCVKGSWVSIKLGNELSKKHQLVSDQISVNLKEHTEISHQSNFIDPLKKFFVKQGTKIVFSHKAFEGGNSDDSNICESMKKSSSQVMKKVTEELASTSSCGANHSLLVRPEDSANSSSFQTSKSVLKEMARYKCHSRVHKKDVTIKDKMEHTSKLIDMRSLKEIVQRSESVQPSTENTVNVKKLSKKSRAISSCESQFTNDVEVLEDSSGNELQHEVKIEYLLPSIKDIGILSLTFLPGGTISVPNFIDKGLLKFYHNTEDILRDINNLIHNKLACRSLKCSAIPQINELCSCVTWRTVSSYTIPEDFPQFSPEIFSGFYMLNRHGLVDLRTANDEIIDELGEDWVEWLKDDEIRNKLSLWKKAEEEEMTEMLNVLGALLSNDQKSNLPLPQMLDKAKDEIAKLKAANQLLGFEKQTQVLMRETLIYSMCRKFDGIPSGVVPHLLEQMELDLLWELLECMDKRNTALLPKESISLHHVASKNTDVLNTQKNLKTGIDPQNVSIQFKDAQDVPSQKEVTESSDKVPLQPLKSQRSILRKMKKGVPCQASPSLDLNVCVQEDGIEYASLKSPHQSTGPLMVDISKVPIDPLSPPGKQPIILRKNKAQTSDGTVQTEIVLSPTNTQRMARKQTFSPSEQKGEEPIFMEKSVNCELQYPKESFRSLFGNVSRKILFSESSGEEVLSTVCPLPSLPSAVLSQVPSTVNPLPLVQPTMYPPSSSLSDSPPDPISSLRITSVQSRAFDMFPSTFPDTAPSETISSSQEIVNKSDGICLTNSGSLNSEKGKGKSSFPNTQKLMPLTPNEATDTASHVNATVGNSKPPCFVTLAGLSSSSSSTSSFKGPLSRIILGSKTTGNSEGASIVRRPSDPGLEKMSDKALMISRIKKSNSFVSGSATLGSYVRNMKPHYVISKQISNQQGINSNLKIPNLKVVKMLSKPVPISIPWSSVKKISPSSSSGLALSAPKLFYRHTKTSPPSASSSTSGKEVGERESEARSLISFKDSEVSKAQHSFVRQSQCGVQDTLLVNSKASESPSTINFVGGTLSVDFPVSEAQSPTKS